jgi:hypothetical protein
MSEFFTETETEKPSLTERVQERTPEERATLLGRGLMMMLEDQQENTAFYDQAADRRTMKEMGVMTASHEEIEAFRNSRN